MEREDIQNSLSNLTIGCHDDVCVGHQRLSEQVGDGHDVTCEIRLIFSAVQAVKNAATPEHFLKSVFSFRFPSGT